MIYVIQIGEEKQRLIEAASKKQAIQFCLPVVILAEKATAANVAELMALGAKVERVKD